VRCENKQTIVISGLRRENKTKTKTGIPLIMDIPVVGRLFSTTVNNTINTNLLVFITPHIVTETSDILEMTELMKTQRLENEEGRFIITGKGGKESKKNAPKVIWNN
jgi:general secretion pathway protein D